MNEHASTFMAQEYDRISTAYFGLREHMTEMFKSYLVLVGFPLTVLAAVVKIDSPSSFSLSNLPDVVSGVMLVVSLLGFLVATIIVSIRMEMILYARTINGVRRYFALACKADDLHLSDYLMLPTSDTKPPFFEGWRMLLLQVLLIGLLNGTIAATASRSLLAIGWGWATGLGAFFLILHVAFYRFTAWRREKQWKVHFPESLGAANW